MINKKLLAVIPAFNEEKAIRKVVKKTRKYCSKVIVVNDGSKDRTARIAEREGAIVLNQKNQGVGAAVRNGYNYALKISKPEDIIINLDADGQHNPDEIPRLIKPLLNNKADLVNGSRLLGNYKETSYVRIWGNKLFSWFISQLIKQKITDTQSGYRLIKAKKLKLLKLKADFTNRQEMIILAAKKGLRITELPINVNSREYGNSFLRSPLNKIRFLIKVSYIILETYFRKPF